MAISRAKTTNKLIQGPESYLSRFAGSGLRVLGRGKKKYSITQSGPMEMSS